MREAGITAAERYKADLESEGDGKQASAGVNLDVDQIMRDPGAAARRRRTSTANAARMQHAALMGANAANQALQAAVAAGAAAGAAAPGDPMDPQMAALVQEMRNHRRRANAQQPARAHAARRR